MCLTHVKLRMPMRTFPSLRLDIFEGYVLKSKENYRGVAFGFFSSNMVHSKENVRRVLTFLILGSPPKIL